MPFLLSSRAMALAVVLSLCGIPRTGHSQWAPPPISQLDRRVISPAPQATQLGAYGNVTPDLATGAIQLQVPVVEATSRQLRLPIALNYHYTGLLVDELPSWAGLGWTLSAGGVITRTIRGLPDELPSRGFWNGGRSAQRIMPHSPNGNVVPAYVEFSNPAQLTTANAALWNLCHETGSSAPDLEPDAYTISMPGYNGKFLLDTTELRVPLLSPHTDVHLAGDMTQWVATAGDGTRYFFDSSETTQGSDDLGALPAGQFPTAWYLSLMVSADGTDSIRFEYRPNPPTTAIPANTITKQVFARPGPNPDCSPGSGIHFETPAVTNSTYPNVRASEQTIHLTRITTATLRIDFASVADRRDVAPSYDHSACRLREVVVYERYSGRLLKRVALTHRYFNPTTADPTRQRLRLDAVTELGKPGYAFIYDTLQAMPARKGTQNNAVSDGYLSKDHWGFYNANGATTLIPSLPGNLANYRGGVPVASREANGAAARVGTLLSVRYPTGGSTAFEYEPNDVMEACGTAAGAYGRGGTATGEITITAQATNGICPTCNATDLENDISTTIQGSERTSSGGSQNRTVPSNVMTQVVNLPYGGQLRELKGLIKSCIAYSCPTASPRDCFYKIGQIPMKVMFCKMVSQQQGPDTYASLQQVPSICLDTPQDNTIANGCDNSAPLQPFCSPMPKTLAPGRYCLVAICNPSADPNGTASLSATIQALINIYPKPDSALGSCYVSRQVGGLRVVRTRDYTGQGDTLTTEYAYTRRSGGLSSGVLFYEPEYGYRDRCYNLVVAASDIGKNSWLESGYHVGYGRVTVRKTGAQVGTTVYTYSTGELAPNSLRTPASLRGLVLKQEHFDASGRLVQRDTTAYQVQQTGEVRALRIAPQYAKYEPYSYMNTTTYESVTAFRVTAETYKVTLDIEQAFWPRVVRTVQTLAGTQGNSAAQTQTVTHHYLPWASPSTLAFGLNTTLPIHTARATSDGRTVVTLTRYPGQYAQSGTDSASLGVRTLVDRGMLSTPVEQQTWLRTGNDSAVVSGQLTQYFVHPPAFAGFDAAVYPRRVFQLSTTAPVPAGSFSGSFVQGGTFQQDGRYEERHGFARYDAYGNLLQQQPVAGKPSSYLWGYAASQPIAEAQGATVGQIAYTSFEPGATGRWQYDSLGQRYVSTHLTGRRAYQLDGSTGAAIRRPNLPAGTYELLVWGHGAGVPLVTGSSQQRYELAATAAASGWRLHRFWLTLPAGATVQVSATGKLWVDELRLAPALAQLSTFTYDPGVGRTSATDPAGRTTTYEYDALGRLVCARDEQGRILAQQHYHYAER